MKKSKQRQSEEMMQKHMMQLKSKRSRDDYCEMIKTRGNYAQWCYADSLRILIEMDLNEKYHFKGERFDNAKNIVNAMLVIAQKA